MREIGIEPPTRYAEELEASRSKELTPEQRRTRFVWNIRTLLLAAIGALLMLNWLGVVRIF